MFFYGPLVYVHHDNDRVEVCFSVALPQSAASSFVPISGYSKAWVLMLPLIASLLHGFRHVSNEVLCVLLLSLWFFHVKIISLPLQPRHITIHIMH